MTYALLSEAGSIAEFPVYEGDIKRRFPNTSFTIPFEAPDGYVAVQTLPSPSVNWDQNCQPTTPALADGCWVQGWAVEEATAEQIAERTAAKASDVRTDRNRRLADCDWTQLPDAPVDHQAWATYRQALRDVSSQPGFPWDVQWPEAP